MHGGMQRYSHFSPLILVYGGKHGCVMYGGMYVCVMWGQHPHLHGLVMRCSDSIISVSEWVMFRARTLACFPDRVFRLCIRIRLPYFKSFSLLWVTDGVGQTRCWMDACGMGMLGMERWVTCELRFLTVWVREHRIAIDIRVVSSGVVFWKFFFSGFWFLILKLFCCVVCLRRLLWYVI